MSRRTSSKASAEATTLAIATRACRRAAGSSRRRPSGRRHGLPGRGRVERTHGRHPSPVELDVHRRDKSSLGIRVGRNRGRVDGRSPVRVRPRGPPSRVDDGALRPICGNRAGSRLLLHLSRAEALARRTTGQQPWFDDSETAYGASGQRRRGDARQDTARGRGPGVARTVPGWANEVSRLARFTGVAEEVAHAVQHASTGQPDPDGGEAVARARRPGPGPPRRPPRARWQRRAPRRPRVFTSRPPRAMTSSDGPALEPLDQRPQLVLVEAAGHAGEVDEVGEADGEGRPPPARPARRPGRAPRPRAGVVARHGRAGAPGRAGSPRGGRGRVRHRAVDPRTAAGRPRCRPASPPVGPWSGPWPGSAPARTAPRCRRAPPGRPRTAARRRRCRCLRIPRVKYRDISGPVPRYGLALCTGSGALSPATDRSWRVVVLWDDRRVRWGQPGGPPV